MFFSQREISKMRRPIGAKFCTMISTKPSFITLVQNFGSPPFPLKKKNLGAKNMQNLARFQTTSKFGGEYIRNQ